MGRPVTVPVHPVHGHRGGPDRATSTTPIYFNLTEGPLADVPRRRCRAHPDVPAGRRGDHPVDGVARRRRTAARRRSSSSTRPTCTTSPSCRRCTTPSPATCASGSGSPAPGRSRRPRCSPPARSRSPRRRTSSRSRSSEGKTKRDADAVRPPLGRPATTWPTSRRCGRRSRKPTATRSTWNDLDAIIDEFYDPRNDAGRLPPVLPQRAVLDRRRVAHRPRVDRLPARPPTRSAPREPVVTLGFDGSRQRAAASPTRRR